LCLENNIPTVALMKRNVHLHSSKTQLKIIMRYLCLQHFYLAPATASAMGLGRTTTHYFVFRDGRGCMSDSLSRPGTSQTSVRDSLDHLVPNSKSHSVCLRIAVDGRRATVCRPEWQAAQRVPDHRILHEDAADVYCGVVRMVAADT
jgi:hypothetical protein